MKRFNSEDLMELVTDPTMRTILETLDRMVEESYVVGGWVRDYLMRRPVSPDLDVAVKGDGFVLAKRVADEVGEQIAFVPLDRGRGTGRIVARSDLPVIVDISSFKGSDIVEDLRNRDFTINAVAIGTRNLLNVAMDQVIDPVGGLKDLRQGVVRACSDRAFSDDPVRILRAFRFSGSLGFEINRQTLALIPRALDLLTSAAPERIRDEFFGVLSAGCASKVLIEMDDSKALGTVFPELLPMKSCTQNYYHHLNVWDHTIETVKALERIATSQIDLLGSFGAEVQSYLSEEPVPGRCRAALLKFAALFHDVGKPQAKTVDPDGRIRFFGHEKVSRQIIDSVTARIRLSAKEIRIAGEWVSGHMRPGILLNPQASRRGMYRLCRGFGKDVFGLLMLFLADLSASRGPARREGEDERAAEGVRKTLGLCRDLEANPKPLLNGHELMSLFGLQQGVYLGSLLTRLAELQGTGEITTRRQAIAAARVFIRKDRATGRRMGFP